MSKNKLVLSKWDAVNLACEAAKYCGFPSQDIILLRAVMEVRVDTYLQPQELQLPPAETTTSEG